ASGDFTRFQDLRFGLHTSAGSFRAAGSITGLDFQFGRRRFQLDAAAFAIDNDPAGLRLQAIVYPHDPHAGTAGLSHRPGIYFSATSDDLAIMQQVQDLFSAPGGTPDLKAVLALLRSHPRLFGNNYMVVFSGQAAKMLQAQTGTRLDSGTRLLIDALSGFAGGTRTFAVRGSQVAQLSELASVGRYSDVVEAARDIVPEIDILYSHYLRRIAGAPDSLAHPVALWRQNDLSAVLGAASGSYSTQWFLGMAWDLPHPDSGVFQQRLLAGWLYEQSGLLEEGGGAGPGAVFNPYNYERAGFLQYRADGWAAELETAVHPTLRIDPARRVVFHALLDLGLRQADYLSFADQTTFARPQELLARYDQNSPLGNLFPIFHAETALQYEFAVPAPAARADEALSEGLSAWRGWRQQIGVGCDADAGYGGVARKLHLQLPIVPELTPKVFANFDRLHHRIQLLGAWPTAADQAPFAAIQYTWDLGGR
ncbi:MAG TPA: hypothetical protein VL860_14720, partial [Planctomycetota bacterium]|nr:hypothetical protein [Planctomycetota bacterium]